MVKTPMERHCKRFPEPRPGHLKEWKERNYREAFTTASAQMKAFANQCLHRK
jgi:hypothetical protein